jgi:thiamine pyrophosphate-dependent acetolactate synthase large subunit-like protein
MRGRVDTGTQVAGTPVHVAIAKYLARGGARYCFGVAGTSNFKISHALIEEGIQYVAARHECNAVTMADAYAKATGALTLSSVHAGPGLTNALTGMGEAAKSGTPLVVLAGDVADSDVTSTFFMDQAALARSIGVTPFRINSAATALNDAARAVEYAMTRRATVLLSLPMDVQYALVPDGAELPGHWVAPRRAIPDDATVEQIADLIDASNRPLILAGRGAVLSGARQALLELGEMSGALLCNSLQANGIFSDDSWSLGICGGFSGERAAVLLSQSDLVIGFGASFTYWTTRHGALFRNPTKVVQIDADLTKLSRQRPVDVPAVGDAKGTAIAVLAALRRRHPAPLARWRTSEVRARVAASRLHTQAYEDTGSQDFYDPRTLSLCLNELLPAERSLVIDAGHFMAWPARYISVPDERASCMSVSFQSIGLGIASAIGTAMARPDRLTVLGIGDGGYMMSLADIETAVRLGASLLIVIYDDASYAAEVHPFAAQGYSVDFVRFPDIDLSAVAISLGTKGAVSRSAADLGALRDWLANGARGVFVLDAKINPGMEADWHIAATRGEGH